MPPFRRFSPAWLTVGVLAFVLAVPARAVTTIPGRLQIIQLDVGQGDGAVLITPMGQVCVIDNGPAGGNPVMGLSVVQQLQALGVTHVDYHFLSHYHSDHVGNFVDILNAGITIDYGWDRGESGSEAAAYISAIGANRRTWVKGQVITLDSLSAHPVTITCIDLNGAGVYFGGDENAKSVVLRITYGAFDAEWSGDLPQSVEPTVAPAIGQIEAYKVHHHGSSASSTTEWLAAEQPKIAVISLGTGYGYPKQETLDRLRAVGAHAYWTERGTNNPVPDPYWDTVANGQVTISATWEPGGVDTVRGPGFAHIFTNSGTAVDTLPPTVALTAPVGGEDWKAGSTHAITWTATDNMGVIAIDLAYSADGGVTFPNVIATGLANSGSYPWSVPNAPGSSVRVRVTAHDVGGNLGADSSAANFTISTWTITASAGAGGSVVPSGVVPVVEGASQHFSIAPAPGSHVASLTVDGGPVTPDTAYTFADVTANHALTVTFSAISSTTVVISEFRTNGPNGESDEFVELYNLSDSPVSIGGWNVNGSDASAGTTTLATITAGVVLGAHCHYLLANTSTSGGPYSGSIAPDQTCSTEISDEGGIVLLDGTTIVDQVGMSAGSAYKEGTVLAPLAGNLNRSYERKPGGASGSGQDTDDNASDFTVSAPSDPQNLNSVPPTVALTAPVGGEDWKAGSTQAITWTATDDVGVTAIDLAYSTDGGVTFPNVIAAGLANSGSYAWSVPNAPGSSVRVRVTAHDVAGNLGADSSAANFTISTWTITASAGAGGSVVPSGVVPVVEGASQHFSIAPAPGNHVASLTVDGGPATPDTTYTFANVIANHTLAVTFGAAASATVVISEFRTNGPNGGSDEFIELYNLSDSPVSIGGWLVRGSNSSGGTTTRATITAGIVLGAHCHYLLTNRATGGGPYSGSVVGDQTYSTGITDTGGIGLLDGTTVVDQVGMSTGSVYKEGAVLAALTGNLNQSYERKPGGASGSGQDTDDNASDFQVRAPSDPQNLSSGPVDVVPPVVQVTSPDGGEAWEEGSAQTIMWSASDNVGVDSVNVDCSFTGVGGPWQAVAHGLANSGSLPWTVPSQSTDSALVRVTAYDHALNAGSAMSDSLFHIVIRIAAVGNGGPAGLALARPQPNPGMGTTLLRFSLPQAGPARLEILDLSGRRLWQAEAELEAGPHEWRWDGRGGQGGRVGAGLYFVRLVTPWGTRTERLVWLR